MSMLIFILSMPTILAYVCRLNLLQWGPVKPWIILLHLGLAISTLQAAARAWEGAAEMGELASVVAALAWIVVSFHTWRDGVPEHYTKVKA